MRYLHTMVRITDIDNAIDFYCKKLGLVETKRTDNNDERYTNIFIAAPADKEQTNNPNPETLILRYNWDNSEHITGTNLGHLAYGVENIHEICEKLMDTGVTINRPPRDGQTAIIKSPSNVLVTLIQNGAPLEPKEPWISMEDAQLP